MSRSRFPSRSVMSLVALVAGSWSLDARAQDAPEAAVEAGAAPAAQEPTETPRIRDNLFLLEEAYNQEPGVIQHIQLFQIGTLSKDWGYAFTDEWPVPTDLNQLSVTVPVVGIGETGSAGIGDVLLNWRIQALGLGGKGIAAIAPRASLVFPSGSVRKGHGRGGWGLQLNLPVSIEAGPWFVVHLNAGTTMIFDARDPGNTRREVAVDANAGAALVWQPLSWFNALVEVAYQNVEDVGTFRSARRNELIVNPGVRFAIDVPSADLQIVPGLSVPVRTFPTDDVEASVLVYLSLEHKIW